MKTYGDDLAAEWEKKKWSKLHNLTDVAAMKYDKKQRAKKGKAKIVYEEDDKEEESEKRFVHPLPRKSRSWVTGRYPLYPFENLNGASTSSSSSSLFNLNQIPCNFNKNYIKLGWPPSSSSFLGDYKIADDSQNPNPQSCLSLCLTESRSPKRCGVQERKRNGGFTKSEVKRSRSGVQLNGAENARLIFEKTLLATDVNPSSESHFQIPFNTLIRNDFLTPMEYRIIHGLGGNIGATLVNERSEKRNVMLRMNNTESYALICGWNDFVKDNGLKVDDNISLWSFRCSGTLCFLLRVTPPTKAQSSSSLALW